MKPVIYIDVLFFVNLLINFVLLYTTAKIGRLACKRLRLSIASAVGALYAVCVFFPRLSFIYSIGAKLLSSMAIVAIAFNIKGIRLYMRSIGLFYLVTLCFGGGAFALFYFTDVGRAVGAVISNGVIYLNLPWQLLGISVLISYLVISKAWKALQSRISKDNMYISLSISFGGETLKTTAFVDTGNALCDPLSGAPVIVAEYNEFKGILPEEIKNIYENGYENNLEKLSEAMCESNLKLRVRLIPYNSLGNENGMLIGFRPDGAAVEENEETRQINDVIVALYNKSLSKDKSFHALLHPELLN